jgi:hypothetical protein
MEGQNDNIFLPLKGEPVTAGRPAPAGDPAKANVPKKKVPALFEQELLIFFLIDLFTH